MKRQKSGSVVCFAEGRQCGNIYSMMHGLVLESSELGVVCEIENNQKKLPFTLAAVKPFGFVGCNAGQCQCSHVALLTETTTMTTIRC